MKSNGKGGRIIGITLLLQLVCGLTLPFILLSPIVSGSPAFLTSATENSLMIRAAIAIASIGSILTVFLGIKTFPVFERYGKTTALGFLAACVISCVLDNVHNASVMSMLSFSGKFVDSGVAEAGNAAFQITGAAVAAARRSAHIAQLLAIGVWLFLFHSSLLRFALVPRALAILGVVGVLSQFTGVTLMMFTGNTVIGQMAMPLLPIQIAVGLWLIARGFKQAENDES